MIRPTAEHVLPVIVLACAIAPASAGADPRSQDNPLADYTVTTWSENDGLPAGRIRALAQDTDGYLWLATDAGLVRFDGVRFDNWSAFGDSRLPVGAVTALLSARDGSLWLGVSGRLPIGRIRDRQLTLYGAQDGFGGSYVLSLLEDRTGSIWAATFQGLFRLVDGRWHRVGEEHGLSKGSVLAVFEDRQRRTWAATSSAIFRTEPGGERFARIDEIEVSSNVWQSFSEDARGTVWISDFKEGFRAPSAPGHRAHTIPRRGWGVGLLHDHRGNFWVGTQGQGLWRVRDGPAATPSLDPITVNDGLASNAVQTLLEDREGNVWIGMLTGLQRLTPHRVTPVKDLPIARAIARTTDGSVWVGTAAGLVRFSPAGRREYTEADGLPGIVVLALHADERGGLWVSTERGVARFSHGRFSPLLMVPNERMQRILGITGWGDTVWLRDFYLRVFRWRAGRLTLADDVPESHQRSVSSIHAGSSGDLWIGSSGGRIGVRRQNDEFRGYELGIGNVASIFEDSRGMVWIGGDSGLSVYANGRFVTVGPQNGLRGGVKSILEDAHGLLWIGTDTGIHRLDRAEVATAAETPLHQLRFRLFNTADGVAGIPFSEGSPGGVRDQDGRLWFLATSGVTIVDSRDIGPPLDPPAARIESMAADTQPFETSRAIRLPAGTSHLQISFTALTLSDAMRVRYRYRLDGFDREWVDGGSSRQASYTNLPPRDYQFRVMASGGDGTWGEAAVLAFGIEPTFYQTRWFLLACGSTVFLIVYASWRLHVRQVRHQFALVLGERIRMSRAIHDTLLQGLAALALQVGDLSHDTDLSSASGKDRIMRIRRQVEQYIREARRSILDLRTPALASRNLPQALREVVERAIDGKRIAFDLIVKGTPRPCTPSVEEQILLIGQEAVRNAALHGQTGRIAVEVDYQDDRLRLRVADNGCGFDPESVKSTPGHCGLVSMRERAEQVQGRLTIVSAPGSGTEVEATVST